MVLLCPYNRTQNSGKGKKEYVAFAKFFARTEKSIFFTEGGTFLAD